MTRPTSNPDPAPAPLLGMRAALILSLSLATGAGVGGLTLWAGAVLPAAVLAGLTGYFLHAAVQPPPVGIPNVRAFQLAQGLAALEWLRRF